MRTLSRITLITALALAGCAGGGGVRDTGDSRASRADTCRSGDTVVASESACLQDDASCYQLSNGDWCTGSLAARCPAGSSAVPAGLGCPSGARCFRFSESLECMVDT